MEGWIREGSEKYIDLLSLIVPSAHIPSSQLLRVS